MKKEHQPHKWKEGRRQLSLGTIATRVEAERVSCCPGMSKGVVSMWLNRAKAEGIVGLRHAPAPGLQPKQSAEQLAQLPQVMAQGAEAFGYRGQVWTTRRGGGREQTPGAIVSCGRSDCGILVGYYGSVSLELVALFRSLC